MCPRGVGNAVSRVPRGRFAWAVPLLLFLAILLAAGLAFNLANLDTGGEAIPAAPNAGGTNPSSEGLLDVTIASPLVQVAILVLLGTALALSLRRRVRVFGRKVRPRSPWDWIGTLIAVAIFLALLFVWPDVSRSVGEGSSNATSPTAGEAMQPLPTVSGLPLGLFLALALLGALFALVFFLRLGTVLRVAAPGVVSAEKERKVAVDAVVATIEELHLGEDVRSAILGCYWRFCAVLDARGLRDQSAMTPRELEDLAVRRLQISTESAEALTGLFEEARYSVHALGEADRTHAIASLERIRADLGA